MWCFASGTTGEKPEEKRKLYISGSMESEYIFCLGGEVGILDTLRKKWYKFELLIKNQNFLVFFPQDYNVYCKYANF